METEKKIFSNSIGGCYCSDQNGFYLTKRQASAACALTTLLLTLTFISGYFWGQKKAAQEFTNKVVNDSFADQVNYSMYSLYGDNSASEESDSDEDSNQEVANEPAKELENTQATASTQNNSVKDAKANLVIPDKSANHYAELVGFGSKRNAEQFVNKIRKKGYNINVYIATKKSKLANGKVITWYQIITENLNNKSDLMSKVEKIKLGEKLSGVKFKTIQ